VTKTKPTGAHGCTAKSKRSGELCNGYAMNGQRLCRMHGGSAPQNIAAGERRQKHESARKVVQTYGLPVITTPEQALLDELYRTLGHVQYLGAVIAKMTDSDLKQVDSTGKFERKSVWVELYQDERAHLARVGRDCITAGIEERKVAQLEALATDIVGLIRRVIDRLELPPALRDQAHIIVAEELRGLDP